MKIIAENFFGKLVLFEGKGYFFEKTGRTPYNVGSIWAEIVKNEKWILADGIFYGIHKGSIYVTADFRELKANPVKHPLESTSAEFLKDYGIPLAVDQTGNHITISVETDFDANSKNSLKIKIF